MDDIWIISWFHHTACNANPIWKPPKIAARPGFSLDFVLDWPIPSQ